MVDTQNKHQQQDDQALNMQRQDIHLISQYSNLSERSAKIALKKYIYNDQAAWYKLLQWLLLGLGISFLTSGIIFFFAYNWVDLHKFVKIALIQGLIIAVTCITFIPKLNSQIKNTVLTGSAGLVGVLFAVFGQIYQTGANAYDFFLAWTVFITLWVIISNFAALWLLFLVLINTTFILYSQQVAHDWSFLAINTVLMFINGVILMVATTIGFKVKYHIPRWFLNIIALFIAIIATTGISFGIFERFKTDLLILMLLTTVFYALAVWYAFKAKNSFYLAVVPFSLTIIFSALLFNLFKSDMAFLPICLLIIVAVTFIIKNLIHLQKQWKKQGDA